MPPRGRANAYKKLAGLDQVEGGAVVVGLGRWKVEGVAQPEVERQPIGGLPVVQDEVLVLIAPTEAHPLRHNESDLTPCS